MKRDTQIVLLSITILFLASVLSVGENPFKSSQKELVCTAPVNSTVLSLKWLSQQKLAHCSNSEFAWQYTFRFDSDLIDKQDNIDVHTTIIDNCHSNYEKKPLGEPYSEWRILNTTSSYLMEFHRSPNSLLPFEVKSYASGSYLRGVDTQKSVRVSFSCAYK